ncbi:hypothetical protein [Sedimentibacter sp. MB31-C6]|uniref:hypothetical protein n=1 Tax=Sedimentibacter sp. MB31-C6 TaxID=3109366 RepID=UPI002DDCFBF8|nr:hypothetical protein [Sedimentibacter sp. MB36-C1]WSI04107.1 hypothetical protein U8307_14065 [Sedimentibacter sp. MB36-C1]
MSSIKSILNNKKPSFWIFAAVIVIVVSIAISLGTNPIMVEEYQFPLTVEDIEKVLTEQKLDWYIKEHNGDDTRDIFTLTNDDNITFGINSYIRENKKVLNLSWYLPSNLTADEVENFYYNELSRNFKLPGIIYGNKKKMDKALSKLLDYYLNEENYENGLYWNKRVGDDHLRVSINNENRIVSLQIIPNELYEDYLRALNDSWKRTAEVDNIKIFNSTVADMKEGIPPVNDIDIFSKHFIIHGNLEDINELKKVPESLKNIKSKFLMPNKDKYLNAKLVDNTGSVNVFLQMNSLNSEELNSKRNHHVAMFYYNNEPFYVVRFSVLYSEEMRAEEIAKDFIMDLYTVDAKETDNYESILNMNTVDAKALTEATQINDEVLKSLMTVDAYDTLLNNRENLLFAQACYKGNYTMRVAEIQLSENKNNIENNESGYNFEVLLNIILNDGTVRKNTAKGLIELDNIDDIWKVTGYRNIIPDFIMD